MSEPGGRPDWVHSEEERASRLTDEEKAERKAARRARMADPANYPESVAADGKMSLPAEVYKAIDGPMHMAFELAGDGMASVKDRDEIDANEFRMRGIWHALHYVQRRLSGWDLLPTDFFEDRIKWEEKTQAWKQDAGLKERVAARSIPTDVWSLAGLDEGGLPIHLPMMVTRDGQGPADINDAAQVICWCQNADCPVTKALMEAVDVGAGTLAGQVVRLEGHRDILLQAIWDARRELGFDTDGDDQFHITKDDRGITMVATSHVDEAKEIRKDYDDLLEAWQPEFDLKAMARLVLSLDTSIRQFEGEPHRKGGSSRMKREQGRLNGALSCWEALTKTQGDDALALARKMVQEDR